MLVFPDGAWTEVPRRNEANYIICVEGTIKPDQLRWLADPSSRQLVAQRLTWLFNELVQGPEKRGNTELQERIESTMIRGANEQHTDKA